MSHRSVRLLIRDAVKSVRDDVQFIYGRKTDVNQVQDKKKTLVHLDLMEGTASFTNNSFNLTKVYRVGMVFYRLDNLQGSHEESTKILDEMDVLADKALNKLNLRDFITSDSIQNDLTADSITISSIRRTPFVKQMDSAYTGWLLEFDLTAPDTFDYCALYDA